MEAQWRGVATSYEGVRKRKERKEGERRRKDRQGKEEGIQACGDLTPYSSLSSMLAPRPRSASTPLTSPSPAARHNSPAVVATSGVALLESDDDADEVSLELMEPLLFFSFFPG